MHWIMHCSDRPTYRSHGLVSEAHGLCLGVEAECVETDPPRSSFSVIALHDVVLGPRLAEAEGQRLAGVVILRLAGGDDLDHFPHEERGQPELAVIHGRDRHSSNANNRTKRDFSPTPFEGAGATRAPENRFVPYFCTTIVAEPVSGGLAESVAVTVTVCDPAGSAAVFKAYENPTPGQPGRPG
jgi:hypothetical protein